MQNKLFIASLILAAVPGFAKPRECATVKSVTGDTCETLKIDFDVKSCPQGDEKVTEVVVKCLGKKASATAKYGNRQLEASFEKTAAAWGESSWQLEGKIHDRKIKNIDADPKPKKEAKAHKEEKAKTTDVVKAASSEQRTIAAALPLPVPKDEVKSSDVKLTFSGYVDFRFSNFFRKDKDPSTDSGSAESGFGLEDGAFYLNVEKEKYNLIIDVPFRKAKGVDDSGNTDGNASNTSKVLFGSDKAQFIGRVKLNDNLLVNVGQFDTPYGVELNDSKDRFFNKTGLVYDATLPVTHTGVLVEVPFDGYTWKVLSANSNNKGSLGNSSSGDNFYEFGTTFGFSNEKYRFQLGGLSRPINKADGTKGSRNVYDLTLGTTLGAFTADAEYAMVHDESKNTLTSADTSDKEDDGTGAMLLLTYQFNPKFSLGLRAERLDNDPGASSTKSADTLGAAVHFKPMSDIELRLEMVQFKMKKVDGTKPEENRFSLGSLFFF